MKSSACRFVSDGWAHPTLKRDHERYGKRRSTKVLTFTMPMTVGSHAPIDAGLSLSRDSDLRVVSEVKVGGRPWSKDYGGPRPDPQTRPKTTPASCRGCFFCPRLLGPRVAGASTSLAPGFAGEFCNAGSPPARRSGLSRPSMRIGAWSASGHGIRQWLRPWHRVYPRSSPLRTPSNRPRTPPVSSAVNLF